MQIYQYENSCNVLSWKLCLQMQLLHALMAQPREPICLNDGINKYSYGLLLHFKALFIWLNFQSTNSNSLLPIVRCANSDPVLHTELVCKLYLYKVYIHIDLVIYRCIMLLYHEYKMPINFSGHQTLITCLEFRTCTHLSDRTRVLCAIYRLFHPIAVLSLSLFLRLSFVGCLHLFFSALELVPNAWKKFWRKSMTAKLIMPMVYS